MDGAALLKIALVLSIAMVVFSVGLGVAPGTLRNFLASPRPAAKAMLAMFVAMPLFVLLMAQIFPLQSVMLFALAAISISPMPPILPLKERKAGADMEYALGIQVSATLLSLLVAPLWVLLFERFAGRDLPFSAGTMLQTLLITLMVPLTLGIVMNRYLPAYAKRLERPIANIATTMLLVGALVLLVAAGPMVWRTLGGGSVAAVLVVTLFGLAVGYLMGGPDLGNRGALALATASRHPGVALGVATAVYPGENSEVVGAVLLYFLVSAVIGLPLVRWAQKRSV